MSPSGELARGGGMVVKNVSGYDMMRLHYGALGSLGVIVQLNFKVLPRPPAQRTVVVRFADLENAVRAALAVRESQLTPTAITMLDETAARNAGLDVAPWTVLMRAEGPAKAAAQQTNRLRESALVGSIESEVLEDAATEALWATTNASLAAAPEESAINVRIGMPATRASEIIQAVSAVSGERSLRSAVSVDIGNGLLFARFDADYDHLPELQLAWDALRGIGSHASLIAAPPSVKQGIDVYGSEPEGFGLMRALKQQFDPRRTLNRGRFIGHL
jgi:glycolate oxidase FAD binding subunit